MAKSGCAYTKWGCYSIIADRVKKVPLLVITFALLHPYLLSPVVDAEECSLNGLKPCGLSGVQNSFNFSCDLTPAEHDNILQKAVAMLQKGNFTVEMGHMVFNYSTQFAANPSSPYGTYRFNGTQPFWRLNENDAMVFFGCTPPPMKYFSFRSYVFTTFHNLHPTILFASLGDSMNQLVINTTGTMKGDPFGKTTVVTTTADIRTDQAVRDVFVDAGVPATAINTDIIPSSLVKMGLEKLADTFGMLCRVAVFENPEEVQAYINFTWPVLYIRPPPDQIPLPFATPPLRKRGTGKTEASYTSSQLELVKEVNETIQAKGSYSLSQEQMAPLYLEGRTCIEQYTDCLGDNRDAGYMNSTSLYTLKGEDDPSFFIICGLNHVKTGKSTYINFAAGDLAVDDSHYGESAKQYAPNLPNVDMFYAYKMARQCNGESYCLEVPVDKIKEDEPFYFVARAYLEPPTKVGPDDAELLLPYILHFTPR